MGKTKDVRAAVEAELGFDPLVDSADIKVMNVMGDVTLAGTVPSYPQYVEAAAAARRVAGVSGVHNNLMVVLPDRDYRDDVQLITAANNALAQNITVPDGVEAIANDGNIILTGTVSYLTERAAAEAAVAGLVGVRNAFSEAVNAFPPRIRVFSRQFSRNSSLIAADLITVRPRIFFTAARRLSRAFPPRPPAASRACPHLAARPRGAGRARGCGYGAWGQYLSMYGYRTTDRRPRFNVRHTCPARHGWLFYELCADISLGVHWKVYFAVYCVFPAAGYSTP
jgi:osmotically-inducible protein OsmY